MTLTRQDADPLAQVEALLRSLAAALCQERSAVACLDGAAIERVRQEKSELAATIVSFDPILLNEHPDRARLDAVRANARRVMHEARANAMLLSDATEMIATRMGVRRQAPTYDRRARMRAPMPQALTGRAV